MPSALRRPDAQNTFALDIGSSARQPRKQPGAPHAPGWPLSSPALSSPSPRRSACSLVRRLRIYTPRGCPVLPAVYGMCVRSTKKTPNSALLYTPISGDEFLFRLKCTVVLEHSLKFLLVTALFDTQKTPDTRGMHMTTSLVRGGHTAPCAVCARESAGAATLGLGRAEQTPRGRSPSTTPSLAFYDDGLALGITEARVSRETSSQRSIACTASEPFLWISSLVRPALACALSLHRRSSSS
jgi:hypothetical protein